MHIVQPRVAKATLGYVNNEHSTLKGLNHSAAPKKPAHGSTSVTSHLVLLLVGALPSRQLERREGYKNYSNLYLPLKYWRFDAGTVVLWKSNGPS